MLIKIWGRAREIIMHIIVLKLILELFVPLGQDERKYKKILYLGNSWMEWNV
jgi:hypothetical protein